MVDNQIGVAFIEKPGDTIEIALRGESVKKNIVLNTSKLTLEPKPENTETKEDASEKK